MSEYKHLNYEEEIANWKKHANNLESKMKQMRLFGKSLWRVDVLLADSFYKSYENVCNRIEELDETLICDLTGDIIKEIMILNRIKESFEYGYYAGRVVSKNEGVE